MLYFGLIDKYIRLILTFTGRSIGRLVDRSTHDQSLSIVDSEARACWLSTMSKSEWDNPEFKKNFVQ